MLTVGSLFTGIGGLDLGLERAGMQVRWQVESNEFCVERLNEWYPDVQRLRDVRDAGSSTLPVVDVIAGGFPCQDIADRGLKRGIEHGDRSGLWHEFERCVGELRPRYVIVENVASLLVPGRGFDRVLAGLAESGYDAEWDCLPASFVGAPHERDRVFLVAYARGVGPQGRRVFNPSTGGGRQLADTREAARRHWAVEPDVGRVAYGIPRGKDWIIALGNAVVPQVGEYVGRCVLAHACVNG